ncbi:RNA polymerase sigma factor [Bremerella cremea]|uniref:RNA polymerase sigma factor n=1 Tax=Bremerella cremea TaxID=1031537 RepID=A0A368KXF1_9BACT|nr:RNA polymerase sigma factor [Bremerella cremea]RCS55911.1 RNA polymerase sigma factor [Bremerella cremea]
MNDAPTNQSTNSCLLREHGQSVWNVIVRLLGDDGHDAADCFQQTYLQYAAQADKKSPVRNPNALLKKIAAARAIDLVRRRIRERGRTTVAEPDSMPAQRSFNPEAVLAEEELREALRFALIEIPPDQATAFVLTAIEEVSHEDAASVLGVTVNHLGVLLFRARKVLQTKLSVFAPEGRAK